jgi:hypothetical protein
MVLISEHVAATVKPTKASGSEMSQTKGHTTKASNANGQLTASRMNQPTRISCSFIAGVQNA